jgi:acetyl-CoA carboxylase biotin carboxyl carrier protein
VRLELLGITKAGGIMKIDIKAIKELAENVEKYGLEEITLEIEGTKVTIKREVEKSNNVVTQQVVQAPATQIISEPVAETATQEVAVENDNYQSVQSPMVGTFYSAPSPDADPFVSEGKVVEPGDTLCIVEAMKLMNEVKAEKKCKIVKCLLSDGDPVTKGADLFLIEEL